MSIAQTKRTYKERLDFLKSLESKWQKLWDEHKLFWAEPSSKPKFMVTFPYPYINAYPHIGSAFTLLRVEFLARYKRMRGYNVLFAQGWHATGGPIVAAALRVKEGDPKQINTLRSMGIPTEEIRKFSDPSYWVRFFSREWRRDLERLGVSVDWRREFYTTRLNPPYSKFVGWQYEKLREKGLVFMGSHPVVWCPREKKVVGDHDRPDEFVGIRPEEVVIIKFRDGTGRVFPCLTYRPETVYGVTNVWLNPSASYVLARVNGETWVASRYIVRELSDQGFEVETVGEVKGSDLIGVQVNNPVTNERVLVLPASFVDPDLGTGVVMSVPAHAPYDYVALEELKSNPEELRRYGLDHDVVNKISMRSLISLEGYGDYPAAEEVKRRGIKSQLEKQKLDEATREIYAKEYHQGVLKDVFGDLAGKRVHEAKDVIVGRMVDNGAAIKIYTLPSKVLCRCGSRTHVKIVKNQWFLKYSDPDWKRLAHECIDSMRFYPEEIRDVFHKQVDWLQDWACAHQGELGTPLPWDPEWVVESLSDSTIYMAYYILAKYLQNPDEHGIDWDRLTPEFFDYVLLGKGSPTKVSELTGISVDLLDKIRSEFEYWYPVDFRNSGKDLVYNHLIFFILHHVAIFPRDKWPRGVGVNGWVLVGGKKMAKSLGNFILLREALDRWGADATRLAEAYAGDPGFDDPSFDPKFAEQAVNLLYEWYEFAVGNYGRGRERRLKVDDWFESVLNKSIKEVTRLMEETRFRSALIRGFFDLQNKFKWYVRRCGEPNKELLQKYIEVQTLFLAPFTPHVAEEIWSKIGKKGFVSLAEWPRAEEDKIRDELELLEEILSRLLEDCKEVISLLKGEPEMVKIILPSRWKYGFLRSIRKRVEEGQKLREAVREALRELDEAHKGVATTIVKTIIRDPSVIELVLEPELERSTLAEAKEFLSKELGGVRVELEVEEESKEGKARLALPARPSIVVRLKNA